jgi:hypothetical protein
MYRFLLVAAALSCLPACTMLSPDADVPVQPSVSGEWSGTFHSSWGALPVRASLTNERYSTAISGQFTVDGQRATGTVSGLLETRDRYSGTLFWGTLTISYVTATGETCQSESAFATTFGSASEGAVDISTDGFPRGNCPDPPTKVHLTLRR